jgi:hypothetical protein
MLLGHFEAGGGKRVVARRDTHLDEAAHLLDVLLLDEAGGVEVFDLARDPAVKRRRIEGFDARDAIAAFEQRLPGVLRGVANRGQKTDAGDYNSAGNNRSPLTHGTKPAGTAQAPDIQLDASTRPQGTIFSCLQCK